MIGDLAAARQCNFLAGKIRQIRSYKRLRLQTTQRKINTTKGIK